MGEDSVSNEKLRVCFDFGYEYCRLGRSSLTSVPLNAEELSAFEEGYARRYEEEQQLTHKTGGA
jgi:hypothetical protein